MSAVEIVSIQEANVALARSHYLGPVRRGVALRDSHGVVVLANPSSRRLPHGRWVELVRWCLDGTPNAGSSQWSAVAAWLRLHRPAITTVVSYSDPSAGHTGALYRACNWVWAPTWHRLRPPPTGNGNWGTGDESVKDRWVYVLAPDGAREEILSVKDESLMRATPWASYREPRFRRAVPVGGSGGGDWKRWHAENGKVDVVPRRCAPVTSSAQLSFLSFDALRAAP